MRVYFALKVYFVQFFDLQIPILLGFDTGVVERNCALYSP